MPQLKIISFLPKDSPHQKPYFFRYSHKQGPEPSPHSEFKHPIHIPRSFVYRATTEPFFPNIGDYIYNPTQTINPLVIGDDPIKFIPVLRELSSYVLAEHNGQQTLTAGTLGRTVDFVQTIPPPKPWPDEKKDDKAKTPTKWEKGRNSALTYTLKKGVGIYKDQIKKAFDSAVQSICGFGFSDPSSVENCTSTVRFVSGLILEVAGELVPVVGDVIKELGNIITGAESPVNKINEQIEQLQAQLSGVNANISELNQQISNLQAELENINNQSQKLRDQIKGMAKDIVHVKQIVQDTFDIISKELPEMSNMLKENNSLLKDLNTKQDILIDMALEKIRANLAGIPGAFDAYNDYIKLRLSGANQQDVDEAFEKYKKILDDHSTDRSVTKAQKELFEGMQIVGQLLISILPEFGVDPRAANQIGTFISSVGTIGASLLAMSVSSVTTGGVAAIVGAVFAIFKAFSAPRETIEQKILKQIGELSDQIEEFRRHMEGEFSDVKWIMGSVEMRMIEAFANLNKGQQLSIHLLTTQSLAIVKLNTDLHTYIFDEDQAEMETLYRKEFDYLQRQFVQQLKQSQLASEAESQVDETTPDAETEPLVDDIASQPEDGEATTSRQDSDVALQEMPGTLEYNDSTRINDARVLVAFFATQRLKNTPYMVPQGNSAGFHQVTDHSAPFLLEGYRRLAHAMESDLPLTVPPISQPVVNPALWLKNSTQYAQYIRESVAACRLMPSHEGQYMEVITAGLQVVNLQTNIRLNQPLVLGALNQFRAIMSALAKQLDDEKNAFIRQKVSQMVVDENKKRSDWQLALQSRPTSISDAFQDLDSPFSNIDQLFDSVASSNSRPENAEQDPHILRQQLINLYFRPPEDPSNPEVLKPAQFLQAIPSLRLRSPSMKVLGSLLSAELAHSSEFFDLRHIALLSKQGLKQQLMFHVASRLMNVKEGIQTLARQERLDSIYALGQTSVDHAVGFMTSSNADVAPSQASFYLSSTDDSLPDSHKKYYVRDRLRELLLNLDNWQNKHLEKLLKTVKVVPDPHSSTPNATRTISIGRETTLEFLDAMKTGESDTPQIQNAIADFNRTAAFDQDVRKLWDMYHDSNIAWTGSDADIFRYIQSQQESQLPGLPWLGPNYDFETPRRWEDGFDRAMMDPREPNRSEPSDMPDRFRTPSNNDPSSHRFPGLPDHPNPDLPRPDNLPGPNGVPNLPGSSSNSNGANAELQGLGQLKDFYLAMKKIVNACRDAIESSFTATTFTETEMYANFSSAAQKLEQAYNESSASEGLKQWAQVAESASFMRSYPQARHVVERVFFQLKHKYVEEAAAEIERKKNEAQSLTLESDVVIELTLGPEALKIRAKAHETIKSLRKICRGIEKNKVPTEPNSGYVSNEEKDKAFIEAQAKFEPTMGNMERFIELNVDDVMRRKNKIIADLTREFVSKFQLTDTIKALTEQLEQQAKIINDLLDIGFSDPLMQDEMLLAHAIMFKEISRFYNQQGVLADVTGFLQEVDDNGLLETNFETLFRDRMTFNFQSGLFDSYTKLWNLTASSMLDHWLNDLDHNDQAMLDQLKFLTAQYLHLFA